MKEPKTFLEFVESPRLGVLTDFKTSPVRGTTPQPEKTRFPSALKQAAFKTQKWGIRKGSLRGWFYVKVYNTPENRILKDWLSKVREPGFTYHVQGGGVMAWQWCLPAKTCLDIWNNIDGEIYTDEDAD